MNRSANLQKNCCFIFLLIGPPITGRLPRDIGTSPRGSLPILSKIGVSGKPGVVHFTLRDGSPNFPGASRQQ